MMRNLRNTLRYRVYAGEYTRSQVILLPHLLT